jgi:hypothetical protein
VDAATTASPGARVVSPASRGIVREENVMPERDSAAPPVCGLARRDWLLRGGGAGIAAALGPPGV